MAGDNKPALVALRRRRDQVIEALSDHFANDALTVEEFEDRLELAHQTTAPAELDALLHDLDVDDPGETEGPPRALVVARRPAPPAVVPEESKRIRSILSTTRREGAWRVPKKLRVVSVLGDARIDFRDVELRPGVTEVHARSILGSVEILVPPTLAVECEGTTVLGEFQEMHRAPAQPDPDAPLLVVSGSAVLGELKIETRRSGESGRQARRRRKRERKLERVAGTTGDRKRLTDGG